MTKQRELSRDDMTRALACLTSTEFLNKFLPILDGRQHKQPEIRWLLSTVVTYHNEYKHAPTFAVLRSLLNRDTNAKDEEVEIIEGFIDEMESEMPKARERPYYGEVLESFIQTVYIRQLTEDVSNLMKDNRTIDAETLIATAKIPKAASIAVKFLPTDIDMIFMPEDEQQKLRTVPTGIKELDERLRGGLRPGELGVFMAPTGFGKSMALVDVAAYAWLNGRNVIHFSFENSEEETMRRYVANMAKQSIEQLVIDGGEHSASILKLKTANESTGSMIAVSRLVGMTTNTDILMADLLATEDVYDFTPDLLIVDYGDLMRPVVRGKNKYEDMQNVFAELRDFAALVGIPMWTATQSNREGLKAKHSNLAQISDSLGKAMTADCIIGIARPEKSAAVEAGLTEEITGDIAEFQILKLRRGAEGTLPIKLRTNFALARFEAIDDEHEEEIREKVNDAKDNKAKRKWIKAGAKRAK